MPNTDETQKLSDTPTLRSDAATTQPGGAQGSISGTTLGNFEIVDLLGAGGFGEVYRARDTRLGRSVAVKLLPESVARDPERLERFRREAMAASALNHSNICTVHELVEASGHYLLVMELVEGKTLHAALASGPLPPAEAIGIAIQIADALAEAHRAGIIHRDIKAGNVIVTPRGRVKVLDFGLAKRVAAGSSSEAPKLDTLTGEGIALGTLTYMAPEQLLGQPVDQRSDLFSFGVLLYEMVTGRRPFHGSTAVATVDAILHKAPTDFGNADLPNGLKTLILKLLEKEPARRPPNAEEVQRELEALKAPDATGSVSRFSRKSLVLISIAALVVLAVVALLWHRASRERWVRETAMPEIVRLGDRGEFTKAAALIREARVILPNDRGLETLWMDATAEVSIKSVPSGAAVSVSPFPGDANSWESLGNTPLENIRLPKGVYVWRIASQGFAETQFLRPAPLNGTYQLQPEASVPAGMSPVSGAEVSLGTPYNTAPAVKLADFLIDRHEVTNEEYAKFVAAGGYQRRELWKAPFVRDGLTVPWEEAVAYFKDTTGRPGPASWEVGSFPAGKANYPVSGVSWHEAAAYAEFAGKSLPTAYHWTAASQAIIAELIAPGGNFQNEGTQPVGSPGTVSGSGTTDMAGNVKEWCQNESTQGKRFILGGGVGEPVYMFGAPDVQSPWERRSNFGFRCVKFHPPPVAGASAKLEPVLRDFSADKPVSDETYDAFRRLYSYDALELNSKVDERVTTEQWTMEKVSFDAAYGGERVIAYIFLPKSSAPPFQTVVYFPGSFAQATPRFDASYVKGEVDFIVKSGRALVWPIYKSTYERQDGFRNRRDYVKQTLYRDHLVMWSKDLGRSLDYIETRQDLDHTRVVYLGVSWGAAIGPVTIAVEPRIKVAILMAGGFYQSQNLPEVDACTFAPRVTIPVLFLTGRYDSTFPMESAQLPYFQRLGTPESDKRHVLYDAGHAIPFRETIRDTLDWLDKYQGPVKPKSR